MSKAKMGYTAMFCAIAIFAIYVIPYYVGNQSINVSASYDYGFDNKVGLAILIFFASIAFAIALFGKNINHKDLAVLDLNGTGNGTAIVRHIKTYVIIQLVISICIALLCWGTYGIGESSYFLKRIFKLEYGLRPYVDFDYSYGLILIYVPYLISKLTGIAATNAYYLFFVLVNVLGVVFQGYIVYHLKLEAEKKKIILLLLFVSSLPISLITGVSSNYFRFLLAPFFLIVYLKQTVVWKKLAIIFFSVFCAFNVSPEAGLVLAICYILRQVYLFLVEPSRLVALSSMICALVPFVFINLICRHIKE